MYLFLFIYLFIYAFYERVIILLWVIHWDKTKKLRNEKFGMSWVRGNEIWLCWKELLWCKLSDRYDLKRWNVKIDFRPYVFDLKVHKFANAFNTRVKVVEKLKFAWTDLKFDRIFLKSIGGCLNKNHWPDSWHVCTHLNSLFFESKYGI